MKNNKTNKISIRLNDKEFEKLQLLLQKSGMIKSEFFRAALFNVQVTAKLTDEERKILRSLFGIATNLNQIAHKVNSQFEFLSVVIELKNTRRNIDEVINKLSDRDL